MPGWHLFILRKAFTYILLGRIDPHVAQCTNIGIPVKLLAINTLREQR